MQKMIVRGLLFGAVFLVACGPAATPAPIPATPTEAPTPTPTLPPPPTPAPAGPLEIEVTLGAPAEFDVTVPQTEFPVNTPIRFIVTNVGAIPHEFMIMPRGVTEHDHALAEVHEEMLGPGMTAILEFTFTQAGEYEFSCLLPGHYEAGMYVPIEVS